MGPSLGGRPCSRGLKGNRCVDFLRLGCVLIRTLSLPAAHMCSWLGGGRGTMQLPDGKRAEGWRRPSRRGHWNLPAGKATCRLRRTD